MDNIVEFEVKRMKNGKGDSNLLIIYDECIPDIYIGTALLVPFVTGYKDPDRVMVLVDESGKPKRTVINTCMVVEYIFNSINND